MNMRKGFFRFALVFSILAGTIPLLCHEWFFDETEVDVTLPENWKRMSTQERLDSLDGLLSRNEAFFLLSKIKQFRIGSQLRKMIVGKKDQVLRDGVKYSLSFRYHVGWVESGLLGLAGFVSVWIIYGSIRMAILLVPSLPMVHFPSPRLSGWVESLNFPTWRKPTGLATVRITLFGFLALDERPKRPKKPRAVWID
jgi:hypothetical protein